MKVIAGLAIVYCVISMPYRSNSSKNPSPLKPAPGQLDLSSTHLNTTRNDTNATSTTTTRIAKTTTTTVSPDLPKSGEAEKEHQSSLTIFFILFIIVLSILVIHLLIKFNIGYLPESIAVVIVGILIGLILKLFKNHNLGNWQKEEALQPTMFFLIILPPIIFESGYNLHKGNFFQNFGSIVVFAVFGTIISAVTVGGGVYLMGQAKVAYKLGKVESFAFGSMISAVDPVATLAIFHAIDVDPVLYMLVFGESVLNDAVSIVLTTTILELAKSKMSGGAAFLTGVGRFCLMFSASAAIGVLFGLVSAILLKFIDLRKTPSLEVGVMLIFAYAPYGLAEGLHLSGIMAILFCGIVMSHYTHLNLSPITQITVQQMFRTIAFMAETCVFAYLGLAISSFNHIFKPSLIIWALCLCLVARALNIFPLSFLLNYFREHKITRKMQFVMWFSGLRGVIAFALSLQIEFDTETRRILVTTTLVIVLFTLVILGGFTMPIMKIMDRGKQKKKKKRKAYSLSKTKEMGELTDHLSDTHTDTDEAHDIHLVTGRLKGFMKIDANYLRPFFTRKLTQQEVRDGRQQMNHLTNQWYQEIRAAPSESESEQDTML